jgi:hypothetical protein
MVDNCFLHHSVCVLSTKSLEGRLTMAAKALLWAAFHDASAADNIKDVQVRRRKSHGDGPRLLAGKRRNDGSSHRALDISSRLARGHFRS